VLRQRIDSYSYDVDQLLLGTLLFTVIFFLLPTTFVFYLYFGVLRLLVLCLYAALAFLTEGLNHFPLYSLFLSLSDPKSLPSAPPPSPHSPSLSPLSLSFFRSFSCNENLQAAFRFRL
jgi:phosphatidylinositol glycan class Q protein